jgi:hypothetical protein
VQLQLDKPITAGRLNTHAASSDPRSAGLDGRPALARALSAELFAHNLGHQ